MRFDPSRGVPAAELLATLDADELAALFRRYGEEPAAWRIAKAIVEARAASADPQRGGARRRWSSASCPVNPRRPRRIHPATRVFQALPDRGQRGARRAGGGSGRAPSTCCGPGGRLVVLSYHSLEDRIVKRFFNAERRGCICPPEVPVCIVRPVAAPAARHAALDDPHRERDRTRTRAPGAHVSGRPSGSRPDRADRNASHDEPPIGPPNGRRASANRQPTPHPPSTGDVHRTRSPAPAYGGGSPVSKRHQANRRKSYGRRQHELHERTDRDRQPECASPRAR